MRILEENTIGACSIENVKMSDAKEWALRMKEKGYSFKTISNYKRSLKAAFYSAIQDDYIRKNPFDFHINTVIEDDTEPKVPLRRSGWWRRRGCARCPGRRGRFRRRGR